MVKKSTEGEKQLQFKKPATFVPVFSEEKLETAPHLGDIQEISVNIDILDKLNAAAASRRKDG